MITWRPALARLGITAGTSATRRSPGKLSRGTPMIIDPPGHVPRFLQQGFRSGSGCPRSGVSAGCTPAPRVTLARFYRGRFGNRMVPHQEQTAAFSPNYEI